MKKLIVTVVVLVFAQSAAYASCNKVNESEIASMGKSDLHKMLCGYYNELRIETKITNNQIKSGRSAVNENQEFCQSEITKIERVYIKQFKKIPECP